MTTFLPQYYETLKEAVLIIANLKSLAPGDCKTLSLNIFEKTRDSISETTLKRVYGFAYSKFKPSLFTINVMAKYCGYNGWEDFCDKNTNISEKRSDTVTNWGILRNNAAKTTNFTLQALKNKSGIPYNLTIKRQFIDDHFDAFLREGNPATLLCAPSGYGKTIGLCHWIEERLHPGNNSSCNDIILFFSNNALMNVFLSGRDINYWLLGLLGYTGDKDIQTLIDTEQKKEGNFYLIIDGLDEHSYKPDQFELLLNQLIDIFSLYKFTPCFKLVLTMRTATWINNKQLFDINEDQWFKGFIPDSNNLTINVPLFQVQEIKQLCRNINPSIQHFLAIDLAKNFNHPLYFQFYYKKYKNNFTLNNIDHVCIYELISTFILNKIYLGYYSADKLAFLRALINAMDISKEVYEVPKLKINAAIKQYSHAYNELISVGFIKELNKSTGLNYHTTIEFSNNNFLQYTLAKVLLDNNDFLFDKKLVNLINEKFNNGYKLNVLKWCIIYAAKTGQQSSFETLTQASLNVNEKSDLIIFLGDMLEKACSSANKSENMIHYFKQEGSNELFNYFFGLEFISADYQKTLQTLIKFELSNRKKIIAYTGLATIAALQLDVVKLDEYLTKLKSFPQHSFQKFAVNPINSIDNIYQYFSQGTIKKDIFVEITKFYFNPDLYQDKLKNTNSDEVVYLLAAYSLMISNKPHKILRYINALQRVYKKPPQHFTPYSFFINILKADSYYQLGNNEKVLEIYNLLAAVYDTEEHMFTPCMKCMFYGLKIKKALLKKDYENIPDHFRFLSKLCNESGNKLSIAFISFVILNDHELMNINPQFYKQVQYDNTRLLRECNLSNEIFTNQRQRVLQS